MTDEGNSARSRPAAISRSRPCRRSGLVVMVGEAGASGQVVSAVQGARTLLAEHPGASALLEEAEEPA